MYMGTKRGITEACQRRAVELLEHVEDPPGIYCLLYNLRKTSTSARSRQCWSFTRRLEGCSSRSVALSSEPGVKLTCLALAGTEVLRKTEFIAILGPDSGIAQSESLLYAVYKHNRFSLRG